MYINIRKLVEEYGDLIFEKEKIREKFTFVQKAEENGNKEDIAKSFEFIHEIEFELQRYIYTKGDFTLNQAKSKLKDFENKYSYFLDKGEIKEKIKAFNKAVEKKQYGIIISALNYISTFEKNFSKFQKIEHEAFYGKVKTKYTNLIKELKTNKKLTKEEEGIINEENKILKNLHSYNLEKMEESLTKMKLIIENFDKKPSISSKIEASPKPSPTPTPTPTPTPKVLFLIKNFELLRKNIEILESFYIKKLKPYESILESVNSNKFEFIDNDLADLEFLRKEVIINNKKYIEFLKLTENKHFKSKEIKSLEKNISDNIGNYINIKNNFDSVTLVKYLEIELIKHKKMCLSRKNFLNKIVEYFR